MNEEEIRAVVRATVDEMLTSMGMDHEDPLEMQRDFQHLRDWREASEAVKKKGMMTLVGILVVGILGALWIGFKDLIVS